ncbi:hypothetical protein F4824DRAFT_275711 [Ustulina deusta]|nr:hypothetical protein F4824DRAFT_275711 [Ustulina deusta]
MEGCESQSAGRYAAGLKSPSIGLILTAFPDCDKYTAHSFQEYLVFRPAPLTPRDACLQWDNPICSIVTMTVGLESCPAEIVESIAKCLDVTDAGRLRLTSRCLRSKATQGHFTLYFWSKRVKVTSPCLEHFRALTQRGSLGCEIRDLTLVGVVNNTKRLEAAVKAHPDDPSQRNLDIFQARRQNHQQSRDSGQLLRHLSDAFKNIAASSATGKLHSLSLEVTVYRTDANRELSPASGGSWRLVWQSAAETFRIVFSALQESTLQIGNLNIFNGSHLHRCSVASNELSNMNYSGAGLSKTLGSLTSLSISVSERILDITPQNAQASGDSADEIDWSDDADMDMGRYMADAHDENNFTGLAALIHACKILKSLHIHQYGVNRRRLDPHVPIPDERLFQRSIAALDTLPPIEECSLCGVFIRESDLLAFLKRISSSLRRFSMKTVTMTTGSFRAAFDYIASDISNLEYLYFDELMIGRDLVHFTGFGEPRFRTWDGAHGGNTLRREGKEVQQPIPYHLPTGAPLPVSSPERQIWLRDQRRDYGPP